MTESPAIYDQLPQEFRPTPHPIHEVLSEPELAALLERPNGPSLYAGWFNQREKLIALEKEDPLRYGCELHPIWDDARELLNRGNDVLILGGNRAAKTELAAKLTVEMLVSKDNAWCWCFQSDERASIDRQQPYIYRYLPPEIRNAGKVGRITNINYTVKNGFSEGLFVTPRSSTCRFMSYGMEPTALEGAELDLCWCDEMVPADFLETLRYRLLTRGGKMLVTFTPLEGYSVAVKQYLEGARVVSSLPAPLLPQDRVLVPGCPRGQMPYILECSQPGRFVICFFTQFNPFNPYDNLVHLLANAPVSEVMCRAYGWPIKQIAGAFPRFGDVNIVRPDQIPSEGTNYKVIDPGGAKNWFILWLRVDHQGRIYLYREWPDLATYGEWAVSSEKADGKPGPAQRAEGGRGILGYKRLIRELEGSEEIFETLIDPRAGAAQVPGIEDGTSIIDLMADEQLDKDGNVIGPSMAVLPAPASRVDEGTTLINDLLDYNTDAPVTVENAPRLYVSAECANTIYALRTWTGADGEKGATKDPVDCLKYAAKRGLEYVDRELLAGVPGRGW